MAVGGGAFGFGVKVSVEVPGGVVEAVLDIAVKR